MLTGTDYNIGGIKGIGPKKAYDLVKKHKPDLVIMDLQMPRMDGIQAAREIRKISPDTFIIALSQLEDHPHIVKALDAGVRDYILKKDAHMKYLIERIQEALAKKPGPYDGAGQWSMQFAAREASGRVNCRRSFQLSRMRHTELFEITTLEVIPIKIRGPPFSH